MRTLQLSKFPLLALLCAVTMPSSLSQTVTDIANFHGSNGANPVAFALVQGADGNFYGTTASGGANNAGTVFKVATTGRLTTLYNFCSLPNCVDGSGSNGLILATDGNFYGVTAVGGTGGDGTVFRLTPKGAYVVLHSFQGLDGSAADAPLTWGSDGNLYGTTYGGGSKSSGTIFRISTSGSFKILHMFGTINNDGSSPLAGLIEGKDGFFYGTTTAGGADGHGVIYEITAQGGFRIIHSFSGNNGSFPEGNLLHGTDGYFYGVTETGGANSGGVCGASGCGTIFKISANGVFASVHSLDPNNGEGYFPTAGMYEATDGNFYGTTMLGGSSVGCNGGCGTVFSLNPTGGFATVHSFKGSPAEGSDPVTGLTQGTDGHLYGTAYSGGVSSQGTVYQFTPAARP